MNITFDISLSRLNEKLSFDKVSTILHELFPSIQCFNNFSSIGNLNLESAFFTVFEIAETQDDEWTTAIDFHSFPEGDGEFNVLKICERLSEDLNCNCLCGTFGIIKNLDAHDPYWALAFVDKTWYFADTDGMKLFGPYTDGKNSFLETGNLKLLYKIDLKEPIKDMYDYNVLKG